MEGFKGMRMHMVNWFSREEIEHHILLVMRYKNVGHAIIRG